MPSDPAGRSLSRRGAALLLLVAGLYALAPLGVLPYWKNHENIFPHLRSWALRSTLATEGPAGWGMQRCLNHGFGYPLLTFYAPLGTATTAAVDALISDPQSASSNAVRISFAAAWLLSMLAAYRWLRALPAGRGAACLGAALYGLAPYRFVDVYVRGALAEHWAFVFLPLVLLGVQRAAGPSPRRGASVGLALALAGLVLSHNITALWGTGVAVLAGAVALAQPGPPRSRRALRLAAGLGLGVGLSAFFWLPALWLKGLVQAGADAATMGATAAEVGQHAPTLRQLLDPVTWGNGLSVPGGRDGMPFALGIPVLAAWLAALLRVRRLPAAAGLQLALAPVWLAGLLLPVAWRFVPELGLYIQFPWRLLIFTTLSGAACLAAATRGTWWSRPGPCLVGLAVLVLAALPFVRAEPLPGVTSVDGSFENAVAEQAGFIGTTRGEYLPAGWVPRVVDLVPAGTVAGLEEETVVGLVAFPGWSLQGDLGPLAWHAGPGGVVALDDPLETSLRARYVGSFAHHAGLALTLASALALLVLALLARRRPAPAAPRLPSASIPPRYR